MIIVALPLIAGIYAGHWIGRHYGWGYHVLILAGLAAYNIFVFRIALGKRLEKEIDLSAFQSSSPESHALGEQLAAVHANVVRLDEKLRLDAYTNYFAKIGFTANCYSASIQHANTPCNL